MMTQRSVPPLISGVARLLKWRRAVPAVALGALTCGLGHGGYGTVCAATPQQPAAGPRGAETVIAAAPGAKRPPYEFGAAEEALLDEIQRACFLFFWHEVSEKTGMVVDRTSVQFASIAGVGFQLSALPIGVERGWVSKEEANDRALLILNALAGNRSNRHDGLFFHFLDPDDAGPSRSAYEHVVSTIDSAILLAGVIVASEYFGGEAQRVGDRLVAAADWRAFVPEKSERAYESGFISLGAKFKEPRGGGGLRARSAELLPFVWADAGDEQRLVTFLAVGAPNASRGVPPETYYRLRRRLGSYKDTGPMVWFPWSGALFTGFFAHCWIDYASLGTDQPSRFGVAHRAPTDWWENSRRLTRLHQLKSEENPLRLATFGRDAWGLSASDAPGGYKVPGLFPDPLPMPGATPNVDFADHPAKDDWGDGTLAPYAAGSAVLFSPERSLAALRYYRELKGLDGSPLVWRDADPIRREYGFRDAFNLSPRATGKDGEFGQATQGPWVATDYVAIDQGPLLVCIENARTGLIWDLFSSSSVAKRAFDRLGMPTPRRRGVDRTGR